MPFIPHTDEDTREMLEAIGAKSIEALFDEIPAELKIDSLHGIPEAMSEMEITRLMRERAAMDGAALCFIGAGAYEHHIPQAVWDIATRGEYYSAYTPYQAEASQGTLQTIYEYQSMITALTGLDVSNASLYDGATALVEAVLFSHRVLRGKRDTAVVAETVNPMYRRVLATYAASAGIEVVTVPPGPDGRLDPDRVREAASEPCCAAVQSPNFLGIVEDLPGLADAAHASGALAVQVVTEAASFGLLAGGGRLGFDVVCGEAQSFGIAPGFGGPHLGFFACSEKHIRQMPGRLVGESVDEDSNRAFCLTLSTREQHIRRAKATSNICTNQGLMALAATVWLETIGGSGLRELATSCLARTEELKRRIAAVGAPWKLAYPTSPTFDEFLLVGPGSGPELVERLSKEGVLAGVPSALWGGSWQDGILVAVTERNSSDDLDAFVSALERVS